MEMFRDLSAFHISPQYGHTPQGAAVTAGRVEVAAGRRPRR
jgi:hypothetical protein